MPQELQSIKLHFFPALQSDVMVWRQPRALLQHVLLAIQVKF